MKSYLVLLLVALIRIRACVCSSASDDGWESYHLVIQLRKEGGRSTCTDEALIQLEDDMNEWLYGELAQVLGTQATFRLGYFYTTDSANRTVLRSQFECRKCNTQKLSRQLQRAAQGIVDLWIHENNGGLLKGCVGDDTAVALRLDI